MLYSRQLKKRPRRLLSQDGHHVLNLWFIPHHTEVLIMFKHLDDDRCYRALAFTLSIVSSLHDMLQYLCAFSRLGSSHARLGSRRMEFVSADWGGTEGIGQFLFLLILFLAILDFVRNSWPSPQFCPLFLAQSFCPKFLAQSMILS